MDQPYVDAISRVINLDPPNDTSLEQLVNRLQTYILPFETQAFLDVSFHYQFGDPSAPAADNEPSHEQSVRWIDKWNQETQEPISVLATEGLVLRSDTVWFGRQSLQIAFRNSPLVRDLGDVVSVTRALVFALKLEDDATLRIRAEGDTEGEAEGFDISGPYDILGCWGGAWCFDCEDCEWSFDQIVREFNGGAVEEED